MKPPSGSSPYLRGNRVRTLAQQATSAPPPSLHACQDDLCTSQRVRRQAANSRRAPEWAGCPLPERHSSLSHCQHCQDIIRSCGLGQGVCMHVAACWHGQCAECTGGLGIHAMHVHPCKLSLGKILSCSALAACADACGRHRRGGHACSMALVSALSAAHAAGACSASKRDCTHAVCLVDLGRGAAFATGDCDERWRHHLETAGGRAPCRQGAHAFSTLVACSRQSHKLAAQIRGPKSLAAPSTTLA